MNDLKNGIWHGLTVCNQQEADEKIPIFLQIPWRKVLIIEHMLSLINLTELPYGRKNDNTTINALTGIPYDWDYGENRIENKIDRISAVIVGGETSGNKPDRHMVDWVESIADQCEAANVPLFIKHSLKERRAEKKRSLDV